MESSSISEIVLKVFKKCSFFYNGQNLGIPDFISETSEFIINILSDSNHRRSILVHQGSKIPFFLALIISTFVSVLRDENDDTFLDDLTEGEIVLFRNKRGEFLGTDSAGNYKIKIADKSKFTGECITHIPGALSHEIKPYFGNSKILDGRGIKKGSIVRDDFLASLFDKHRNEIKNIINCSFVIVCNKEDAFDIMNNFRLGFSEDLLFSIGEIFPAAYYTPNDIVPFAGNIAKVEPIIKFTSKISTARELILDDKERNIFGLLVSGSDYLNSDLSELTSLMNRRSLYKVLLLGEIFAGDYVQLKEQFENLDMYIWTKGAIEAKISDISEPMHNLCSETNRLYDLLNNCLYKDIAVSEINSPTENNDYSMCRKSLIRIARNNFNGNNKEMFVIKSFSLLNLFEKACFPINIMEQAISENGIKALSPTSEIENLKEIASYFTGDLAADMNSVITAFTTMKESTYFNCPKYEHLIKVLNRYKQYKNKAIVVVPKSYYFEVFKKALPDSLKYITDFCEFTTVNKFDTGCLIPYVIVTGIFNKLKLNPFLLSNVSEIELMCYPSEKRIFEAFTKHHTKQTDFYESNNLIKYEKPFIDVPLESAADKKDEIDEIDRELHDYINIFSINSTISATKVSQFDNEQNASIVKTVVFETGECAFFTKNYTAYVLNSSEQTVKETDVDSLHPGDILIFTDYDNETKDIVHKIMDDYIYSGRCDEKFKESYLKSIYWKTVLRDYIRKHDITYKDLSDKMYDIGKGKHEVTLRTWLDGDDHIVGPRDIDSFYAVALLTEDEEMLKNPEVFCNACREVRSMRIRILKFIRMSIIRRFMKTVGEEDEFFSLFAGDISKMSKILQIEKVVGIENISVPFHLANKPLTNIMGVD